MPLRHRSPAGGRDPRTGRAPAPPAADRRLVDGGGEDGVESAASPMEPRAATRPRAPAHRHRRPDRRPAPAPSNSAGRGASRSPHAHAAASATRGSGSCNTAVSSTPGYPAASVAARRLTVASRRTAPSSTRRRSDRPAGPAPGAQWPARPGRVAPARLGPRRLVAGVPGHGDGPSVRIAGHRRRSSVSVVTTMASPKAMIVASDGAEHDQRPVPCHRRPQPPHRPARRARSRRARLRGARDRDRARRVELGAELWHSFATPSGGSQTPRTRRPTPS